MSPCSLALSSSSASRFSPICNLAGLDSESRGMTLGGGSAPFAATCLLRLRRRRRRVLPSDETLEAPPMLEAESSTLCGWVTLDVRAET